MQLQDEQRRALRNKLDPAQTKQIVKASFMAFMETFTEEMSGSFKKHAEQPEMAVLPLGVPSLPEVHVVLDILLLRRAYMNSVFIAHAGLPGQAGIREACGRGVNGAVTVAQCNCGLPRHG